MKCAVVANGVLSDYQSLAARLFHYDLLICCDGGARHLQSMGILPHVVLGDFDSIPQDILTAYRKTGDPADQTGQTGQTGQSGQTDQGVPQPIEILPFPPEKDYTDSHLAVRLALSRGASKIDLYGATGTRLDHSLSNIFLLLYIKERGAKGRVIDDHNTLFLAEDSCTVIDGAPGQLLSLLALSEKVTGITLTGLKYPLKNAVLTPVYSTGISNVFTEDKATVTKISGNLLIILSRD